MKTCVCYFACLSVLCCSFVSCQRAAESFVENLTNPKSNTEPTTAEANIINNEIAQYFYFPDGTTKNAYTKYDSKHKPSINVYHFQNLSFSALETRLNESDKKNGVQRRVIYKLTADQPFRIKPYNKPWSKWQQGGGMRVATHFTFTLITTSRGTSIERITPLIKGFTKPSKYDIR
ncbi:MAG: hypothetical protein H7A51_07925 [Akkermansiaceae bacterium]|nr:hypothetical protein [Akkermansiaceae bacterium]